MKLPRLRDLSLRWKWLGLSVLASGVVFALALSVANALTRRALEAELGAKLRAVAQAAGAVLPADRLLLLTPGDEGNRTYGHIQQRLKQVERATGVSRIRVVGKDRRVLCSTEEGARVGDPAPELERDRLELARVAQGEATSSEVLFEGKDGRLYKSGYAPVLGEQGEAVATVVVDGSAGFFLVLQELQQQWVVIGVAATLALALTFFGVGAAFGRPVLALVRSAEAMEKGDLASEVQVARSARGDEVGVLARTLEQMRQALQARDRHLQMMLAGVAHEVRNPLGGMELYAGLLTEDLAQQPAQLELLSKIKRELDYLKVLVDDFLDYARTKPLSLEQVDLLAFREEVAELAQPFLSPRSLTLLLPRPEGLTQAMAEVDVLALRRVLLNLVKNACEASPQGGKVTVALARSGAGGGWSIEVSDEGPGVPPEAREGLFEPFFTTKEKGTGLGLAFARKLVEAHRGTLTLLDRAPAPGAHFLLQLPAQGEVSPR